MLSIKNITKVYHSGQNHIVALNDISIDFPETGLVFIVGKSGAGKSTLLNILGGLDKEDKGLVTIDNQNTKEFKDQDFDDLRNYKIGFVFQEFNLLDNLSVYDNIAIALKMQAKEHDATAIDEVLKKVNLEGLGYRKISELSGGQKQRIAIARALIKNPSIILADEPTGALDSKTGIELVSSLKALSEDKLVIAVSHDFDLAYRFASMIIELNDGKIVKKLYRKQANSEEIYKKIGSNILKVSAGNLINDASLINNMLDENKDNLVCVSANPTTFTIAYPELYQEIFKQEDYKNQFVDENELNQDIQLELKDNNEKKKTTKIKKGSLKFKECLKMATKSYKKGIGRIVFLLLFTILSISLTGVSTSLLLTNNARIVSNTLIKNDISLAMMVKDNNLDIVVDDVNKLEELYSNTNFALSKKIEVKYDQAVEANSSTFAMKNFSGIIECANVNDLNLDVIYGTGSFNEESLDNHEIIISDYAAYEISRTGYLGYDVDGKYSVIKPLDIANIIGTKINLRNTSYKIIGIFDTNYEKYLSLLVDETNNPDDDSLKDSLNALKNYYYARIFAPSGFYKKMYDENTEAIGQELYEVYTNYSTYYDENTEQYINGKMKSKDFYTFESNMPTISDVVYGSVPAKLENNQVVINLEMITSTLNFTKYDGYAYSLVKYKNKSSLTAEEEAERDLYNQHFAKLTESLSNITISKMQANGSTLSPYSNIYQGNLEVVAIVSFFDQDSSDIYFAEDFANKLNQTKFNYNQIMFTLDGNINSYTNKINKMTKEGYSVLNIDGQTSFDSYTLDSYKVLALAISCLFLVLSFLVILSFVSTNVNSRRKEIGILRATGAKKKDIIKIFAVEEGLIALVISIVSSILVVYISSILNQQFGNTNIGIDLIVIGFINILAVFGLTFILIGFATLTPVVSIASLKPIDAIRKN